MSIEHGDPRVRSNQEPTFNHPDAVDRSAIPGGGLDAGSHEQVAHGDVPPVIEQRISSAARTAVGNTAEVTVQGQGETRRFVGQAPQTAQTAPATDKKSRKGLWVGVTALGVAAAAAVTFFATRGGEVPKSAETTPGDTKGSGEVQTGQAAPTVDPSTPVEIVQSTAAGETSTTELDIYTINPAGVAADPEGYFADYAEKIGMKYAATDAIDKYFAINNAATSGELDQATALTEMQALMDEQLGGNLAKFATVFYHNQDLSPVDRDTAAVKLGSYVFDLDQNPNLETDVKQFAANLSQTSRDGDELKAYFAVNGGEATDLTIGIGVIKLDPNGQPFNTYNGVVMTDAAGQPIVFTGRPGTEGNLTLRTFVH